ncbi:hypothetical protein [Dysosmobacter sp.]
MDAGSAKARDSGGSGAVQCAQAVQLINAFAGAWNQTHEASSVSLLIDDHSLTKTDEFITEPKRGRKEGNFSHTRN